MRVSPARSTFILSMLVCIPFAIQQASYAEGDARNDANRPNIVLIYGDDVGFGDLSCYGATDVHTPHLDRLADFGMKFTDAHSPSATCTPSRFAMLTGQYAWRQQGTGIARGDAGMIINTNQATLASILKSAGYTTGVVGKWHLGLGDGDVNWNEAISPSPLDIGFDYSFLIPATGDRVPCVYVENRHVVGLEDDDPIEVSYKGPLGDLPTGKDNPDLLKMHPSHGHNMTIINGISRIGHMKGGRNAWWVDEDMADVITEKAVSFVEQNKEDPFFLFFSFHDIHVPRVPHERFVGATPMGPRGDCIAQMDWCVGEVVNALELHGLLDNTLIIYTSDNGPVVDDGYHDDAVEKLGDHQPAGPWRGGKYSNFEGGTRVPMIAYWPNRINAGESTALMCQVDFPATLAELTGVELASEDAPDSFALLSSLLGESVEGRDHLVEHARVLSLRRGPWKLISPGNGPKINRNTDTELGNDPKPQLYNLDDDPGETNNLAGSNPDLVKELTEQLEALKAAGRSRD